MNKKAGTQLNNHKKDLSLANKNLKSRTTKIVDIITRYPFS